MSNKTPKAKKTPSTLKKILIKIDDTLAIRILFGKLITIIGYITLLLTILPMPVSAVRTGVTKSDNKTKDKKANDGGPTKHIVFGKITSLINDSLYFHKHVNNKEYTI